MLSAQGVLPFLKDNLLKSRLLLRLFHERGPVGLLSDGKLSVGQVSTLHAVLSEVALGFHGDDWIEVGEPCPGRMRTVRLLRLLRSSISSAVPWPTRCFHRPDRMPGASSRRIATGFRVLCKDTTGRPRSGILSTR